MVFVKLENEMTSEATLSIAFREGKDNLNTTEIKIATKKIITNSTFKGYTEKV